MSASVHSRSVPLLGDLPPAWRRLLDACREVNFGHIDALEFVDGAPVRFGRTIKTVVPGKNNGTAPAQHERLPIHTRWAEFMAEVRACGQVSVLRLDLDQGLPIKAEFVGPGGSFV